ncbi:MAG: hypothetical protein MPJ50_01635 [Pirellulales bacterium]|nr:hypothetical protein [Pirellulales bacterium]
MSRLFNGVAAWNLVAVCAVVIYVVAKMAEIMRTARTPAAKFKFPQLDRQNHE